MSGLALLGAFLSGLLLGGTIVGAMVMAGQEEDHLKAWRRGWEEGAQFTALLNGVDGQRRFGGRS